MPKLSCKARRVEVRVKPDEEVVLSADEYDAAAGNPTEIRLFGDGLFGVSWPSVSYPWADYRVELAEVPPGRETVESDYQLLRRALKRFRAQGYDEVARHREIIDRIVFGHSPRGAFLTKYLLKQRVVTLDGELYVLRSDVLGQYGINWTDLRENRMNAKLERFLREFGESIGRR